MLIFSDQFYNKAHADAEIGVGDRSAYAGYNIIRRNSWIMYGDLDCPYVRALKRYLDVIAVKCRTASELLERVAVDSLGLDAKKTTASINVKVLPRTPMSPERKALKAFFGARKVNGRNAP